MVELVELMLKLHGQTADGLRLTGRVPRHRGHFQFISFDCQHIKVTL
jgi:hypothetical protein